jgi:hypothetical protein
MTQSNHNNHQIRNDRIHISKGGRASWGDGQESRAEALTAGVKLSSSIWSGQAKLSRPAVLLWSEMGATAAPPLSREELGIGGMERLQPGAGLEECWTRVAAAGSMLE